MAALTGMFRSTLTTISAPARAAAGTAAMVSQTGGLAAVDQAGKLAGRAAGAVAGTAVKTVQELLPEAPDPGSGAAGSGAEPADSQADPQLGGIIGHQRPRRSWSGRGRGYIEVRGLARASGKRVATEVTRALRVTRGVRWADVNAVTGQVLIAFDEHRVDFGTLLETVQAVEESHGCGDDVFLHDGGSHPLDGAQLNAAAVALAADCLALAVAGGGKLLPFRPVPRSARVVIALIDSQPALRRELQRRAGRLGADLVLALGNAVANGLTQDASQLGIDAMHRLLLVSEERAARAAWNRREGDLRASSLPERPVRRARRPRPLPDGPVEEYAAQAAKGSLAGAAGVLAATRSPGRAADTLMAAVPRAARYGREAFAALLARELSRRGVVPMDGSAYRRLDRISVVAVDSRVLRPPAGDDLDPLAEHVLTAARGSGARVLLRVEDDHDGAAELARYVDETLPGAMPLADHVHRMQEDGNGVLVLTSHDQQALESADVGVSVTGPGRPACWAADLVCGPGLQRAWDLLHAVGAARDASKRSVTLALGGSSLGTLLAITNGRQRSPVLNLAPVHVASLIAVGSSAVMVRRLAGHEHPPPMPRAPWHEMTPGQALTRARTIAAPDPGEERPAPDGALSRLAPAAPSALTAPARGVFQLASALGRELQDPLTPVLLFGAAASAIVGSGVDAALVATVMTGSALISGIQRMRAERALRGLTLGEDIRARRLRWPPADGQQAEDQAVPRAAELDRCEHEAVPAGNLLTGDLIAVRANDVVPADARVLHGRDLEMDESSLTGESLPVAKSADPAPAPDLAGRTCMLYDGTTVLAGEAYAVVVAAGTATESGRAVAMAGKPTAPPGVQAQLNDITGVALPVTGVSGALVSLLAAVRGVPLRQAVASGVAVAVAAVPEGLSLVATVAQLAAARRLSRRGVLVRSSRTLGTMGRVSTVCFDKTGTLTEGRLRVSQLRGMNGEIGTGTAAGRRLLTAAWRACPPAGGNGQRRKLTHATDLAIAETGQETLGGDRSWRPAAALPFETSRGYSAAQGDAGGQPYRCAKGSPEEIVARCGQVADGPGTLPLTSERRRAALRSATRLAGAGLRVIAVADGRPGSDGDRDLEDVSGLTLLGFVGIADSPRQQAITAVRRLSEAGVQVAMITGDHPDTARTIAAELGIPGSGNVLTGPELDRLSEDERVAKVRDTAVFARATPEHKVSIVRALQRLGRTVAVTGDGVNDAAAIRLADVGIAVTGSRTRAARSAADMIAQGTHLESIADAMLEGQSLWRSVSNAVSILVGGNAGEVGFTLYGTAVAGRAPLGTRQFLLVNILTDMLPALAVALAPPGNGHPSEPVHDALRRTLVPEIAVRGCATALGAIVAWHIGRATGRARRASTMSLASLVLTQLAQTMQMGWRSPAVLATGTVSALVLAALIQTPGLSQFFGCTPLGPAAWAGVAVSAAAGTAAAVLLPRILPRALPRVFPAAAGVLAPGAAEA